MTSELFVWRWHPAVATPVLCGRLYIEGNALKFVYRRQYRESADALALSPHMPVKAGEFVMRTADTLPRPLADAAPDAWGRRVIEYRRGAGDMGELEYLNSGAGDRIGAFEFTADTNPPNVITGKATYAELMSAAELVERDQPLSPELEAALRHGTSIGGARPKALVDDLDDKGRSLIAKFSSTTDTWPIVRAECAGMQLAASCGINVPDVELIEIEGKDALLLERFDRTYASTGVMRHQLLSALSLLDLDESEHRHASYPKLASVIRQYGSVKDAQELFRRMVFNILIGNTDDHAKNHSAIWDGTHVRLSPAYDIVPMRRVGQEANQAMLVGAEGHVASLSNAKSLASEFGLTSDEAGQISTEMVEKIRETWRDVFKACGMSDAELNRFDGTTILSPAVLDYEQNNGV